MSESLLRDDILSWFSGNVAEEVARATERNRKRFPELAEKE